MRILLVICGDPDPSIHDAHGPYESWFRNAIEPSVELQLFDPRTGSFDELVLDGVDGVLISGSPQSAYAPLEWIAPLESLVRVAIFERRLPVLGVCFGHQLVAQACGGRVVANPRGREIGTRAVTVNPAGLAHELLSGFGEEFHVQVTHCDTVEAPPPGATVLARSALDDCQAFAFETAWCVQFHPELTADIMRSYIHARRERIVSEGLDADEIHASVRDTDAGRRVFARFVERVAADRVQRQIESALPSMQDIEGADVTIRVQIGTLDG